MFFKIDTDNYDAGEQGIKFAKSPNTDEEKQDVLEFLHDAIGALSNDDREKFLKYAAEFHEYKKNIIMPDLNSGNED